VTLDALGNLGDFIGGIGVVVSLIYLAIQVRQNTRAVRASSWQDVVSGARSVLRLRFDHAHNGAWLKGLLDYPDLEPEELESFAAIATDEALQFQQVLSLYRAGQLDESTYEPYLRWFCSIVATPGGERWWQVSSQILVPAMVEEVDRRVSQGNLHDLVAFADAARK